jgi:hypothetical protein
MLKNREDIPSAWFSSKKPPACITSPFEGSFLLFSKGNND